LPASWITAAVVFTPPRMDDSVQSGKYWGQVAVSRGFLYRKRHEPVCSEEDPYRVVVATGGR